LIVLITAFVQLLPEARVSGNFNTSDSEGQKCSKIGLLSSDSLGNSLRCARIRGKRIWQFKNTEQSAIPATNLSVIRKWHGGTSSLLFSWDTLEIYGTQNANLIYWNAQSPDIKFEYPVTNRKSADIWIRDAIPVCFTILSVLTNGKSSVLANPACEDPATVFTTTTTTTTTTIPQTKPNAPSNIKLSDFDTVLGTATLSWKDNSANESNFYITDKAVVAGTALSSIWRKVAADTTSMTVSGLKSGYRYCFDVLAANSRYVSDWSGTTCFTFGSSTSSNSNSTTTTIPKLNYGSGYGDSCTSAGSNLLGKNYQCGYNGGSLTITSPDVMGRTSGIYSDKYGNNQRNVTCTWDYGWGRYNCK
jgi:hypothetical protein